MGGHVVVEPRDGVDVVRHVSLSQSVKLVAATGHFLEDPSPLVAPVDRGRDLLIGVTRAGERVKVVLGLKSNLVRDVCKSQKALTPRVRTLTLLNEPRASDGVANTHNQRFIYNVVSVL